MRISRRVAVGSAEPPRWATFVAVALVAIAAATMVMSSPTPSGARAPEHRVLFVGDSNALSIFGSVVESPGSRWSVAIATRFGCGVVPYTAVSDGVVLRPLQPLCGEWDRARRREIEAQPADTALLFVGGWEQYDRWVAGSPVPFSSERWLRLTARDYARVLREMRRSAGDVGIVLNGCHLVPETGLPVETMYQAGRYAPVINDPARVAATNAAARRAAEQAGFPVRVLDLHGFLCRDGFTETKNGVVLRTDGLHYTAEGSRLIWTWIKREIARR